MRLDSRITVEACRGVSDASSLLLILLVDFVEESADSGILNEQAQEPMWASPGQLSYLTMKVLVWGRQC